MLVSFSGRARPAARAAGLVLRICGSRPLVVRPAPAQPHVAPSPVSAPEAFAQTTPPNVTPSLHYGVDTRIRLDNKQGIWSYTASTACPP